MQETMLPGLCSVICTTYNHAAFSPEAIQSIFDQNYRNIEIVIIDDGSSDDNVTVIKEKLANSPFPSRLITQENSGNVGLNINRALAVARGEYVSFLSLDDLLFPDCIASKIPLLEKDRNMMLVAHTSNAETDQNGRRASKLFKSPLHDKSYSTAAEMLEHEYEYIGTFFVQGMVCRREILDLVGGYDIDQTGDDLIIRTKIWQYMVQYPDLTFALIAEPGFAYRRHGNNIHKNRFRQIRTVLEWHARYFPDRPLPAALTPWMRSFVDRCIERRQDTNLQQALDYSPELRAFYATYKRSWRYRRRAIKRWVRRTLSR